MHEGDTHVSLPGGFSPLDRLQLQVPLHTGISISDTDNPGIPVESPGPEGLISERFAVSPGVPVHGSSSMDHPDSAPKHPGSPPSDNSLPVSQQKKTGLNLFPIGAVSGYCIVAEIS